MKINLFIISILFLSLALQGQESYSKTFDFGFLNSEIVWTINNESDKIFMAVGSGCDSTSCFYSSQYDLESRDFEWKNLHPWMDHNSNEIIVTEDSLFFFGHKINRENYCVYLSSASGDSIDVWNVPFDD